MCKWNSIILFIVSIILSIILIENNYTDSFFGVGGLGALMFYCINKWLFVADKNEIKETTQNANIENESVIENNKSEELSHQNTLDNKPRKNSLLLPILLVIGLIISVVFNINAYIKLEETNTKISRLEKENKEYENAYEKLSNLYSEEAINNITNSIKVEFYDENIVFVIDGYGDYYYTYDQMEQVTQGIDEYSYWAYNKEQAISLGYKKWK